MIINDLYRILFGRGGTRKGTDIDMAEHGRAGGISSEQGFKFTDFVDYAIKITEDGDYTYIAFANPGTAEATEAWKALKIDESTGFKLTWANGDQNYDNSATDLTSLSYS